MPTFSLTSEKGEPHALKEKPLTVGSHPDPNRSSIVHPSEETVVELQESTLSNSKSLEEVQTCLGEVTGSGEVL